VAPRERRWRGPRAPDDARQPEQAHDALQRPRLGGELARAAASMAGRPVPAKISRPVLCRRRDAAKHQSREGGGRRGGPLACPSSVWHSRWRRRSSLRPYHHLQRLLWAAFHTQRALPRDEYTGSPQQQVPGSTVTPAFEAREAGREDLGRRRTVFWCRDCWDTREPPLVGGELPWITSDSRRRQICHPSSYPEAPLGVPISHIPKGAWCITLIPPPSPLWTFTAVLTGPVGRDPCSAVSAARPPILQPHKPSSSAHKHPRAHQRRVWDADARHLREHGRDRPVRVRAGAGDQRPRPRRTTVSRRERHLPGPRTIGSHHCVTRKALFRVRKHGQDHGPERRDHRYRSRDTSHRLRRLLVALLPARLGPLGPRHSPQRP